MPIIPDRIWQSFYTNINQASSGRASSGRAPHQREPGLIRQSLTDAHQALSGSAPLMPTRQRPGLIRQSLHTNTNQASSGRASTPKPTRPHRAEPPHRRQPGLIRQSSTPTPTRPYWAALLCILDLKENQSYDLAHYILCSCVLFYPKLEVVGVIPLDKLHCWFSHHHFRKVRL